MQSSPKSLALELRFSGRSLIKIRNTTGPRTCPWDTPLTTGRILSDDWPSNSTCCVLMKSTDMLYLVFRSGGPSGGGADGERDQTPCYNQG